MNEGISLTIQMCLLLSTIYHATLTDIFFACTLTFLRKCCGVFNVIFSIITPTKHTQDLTYTQLLRSLLMTFVYFSAMLPIAFC